MDFMTNVTQNPALAMGGLGSLGQGIGNLFFDPTKSANKYLNKIPGTLEQYYNPYIQAGQQALPQLQQQFSQLLSNPQSVMNMLGGGYQQSPGYKFALDQALGAVTNQAAAGGMAGSPAAQTNAAGIATQMANQDYYNYLGNMMNLYGSGMGGLGNLAQTGYGASSDLAKQLSDLLQTQASLGAYSSGQKSKGFGDLLGGLGSLAMLAML